MNCEYNACTYEGFESEICIYKKADACGVNGISYHDCFQK